MLEGAAYWTYLGEQTFRDQLIRVANWDQPILIQQLRGPHAAHGILRSGGALGKENDAICSMRSEPRIWYLVKLE